MMMRGFFFVAALVLGTAPGHAATVLTACSEDITDCSFQGTAPTVTSTAGTFDSSYARYSLSYASATTTIPPGNRIDAAFSSASSDFWCSAKYRNSTNSNTAAADQWIGFFDGANVRLGIEGTGNAQEIRAYKRDVTPTKTTLATGAGSMAAFNTLAKYDIHVVYGTSLDVYKDGVNILTYSGDARTNGATTLSKVWFGQALGASQSAFWSEMFCSDSDTRSMRLLTCAPSAAGATQNWTGSAGNINANSFDDTIFNYTITNNDQSLWKSGCTVPTSGTTSIVDVRSYLRLARGASGPQSARPLVNISSTDYDSGADLTLSTSFGNFAYDWGANSPAGGAWSASGLNTIFTTGGFGVKSRP